MVSAALAERGAVAHGVSYLADTWRRRLVLAGAAPEALPSASVHCVAPPCPVPWSAGPCHQALAPALHPLAAGNGYAEPLTPEQQHQAFLSRLLLMLGSFVIMVSSGRHMAASNAPEATARGHAHR